MITFDYGTIEMLHTVIKLVFIIFSFFVVATNANASRAVTLPFTLNFDDDTWETDLAREECGGTSTHQASPCFSGGCGKVTPPTSACSGGGINGGATGFGWFTYSGTQTIHIRFLIKFAAGWENGVLNAGGGLINKFFLQDGPSRTGILGFNCTGAYCAFGVLDSGEAYRYNNTTGAIEGALFKVSATEHSDEWICVEYWINTATGYTGLYIWTQDGEFNGELITGWPAPTGISQTGGYFSYYNCYGDGAADNYYIMDNLVISSEYIGPPDGFLDSARTAAGVTFSGCTLH